jgi:hypothetical protein
MSGFVWFFLFTFGAFEFDTFIFLYRLYYTGTYSLLCLVILLTDFFILRDHVIKKTTAKSAFLWGFWIMFWIGLSNYLLTTLWYQWEEFSFYNLVKNQLYTLSIGVIFTPFFTVINQIFVLRKGITEYSKTGPQSLLPNENNPSATLITIYSKYKEGKFITDIQNLLYIQSCDNYIDICYKNNSTVEHKLVRNTLYAVEKSIENPVLMRCHRSFIININHIRSVVKNSGRYKIILENSDIEIPVSRKYKKALFQKLGKNVVIRP